VHDTQYACHNTHKLRHVAVESVQVSCKPGVPQSHCRSGVSASCKAAAVCVWPAPPAACAPHPPPPPKPLLTSRAPGDDALASQGGAGSDGDFGVGDGGPCGPIHELDHLGPAAVALHTRISQGKGLRLPVILPCSNDAPLPSRVRTTESAR
jgi:hypothetical protein